MKDFKQIDIMDDIKSSPWPNLNKTFFNQTEKSFDDSFVSEKQNKTTLNQNGLQLPDSEHYLFALGLFSLYILKY